MSKQGLHDQQGSDVGRGHQGSVSQLYKKHNRLRKQKRSGVSDKVVKMTHLVYGVGVRACPQQGLHDIYFPNRSSAGEGGPHLQKAQTLPTAAAHSTRKTHRVCGPHVDTGASLKQDIQD